MTRIVAPLPTAVSEPSGDPAVFAAGHDRPRRVAVGVVGLAMLAAAWLALAVSPRAAVALVAVGCVACLWAFCRRGHSYELRREGIVLYDGARGVGERTLVPWQSVAWLGGRPTRGGDARVRLCFRQRQVKREQRLPGGTMGGEDYDRLIGRLRATVAGRFPRLLLGGR